MVALALAAAEAWQQTEATRAAEQRAAPPRWSTGSGPRRGAVPDTEVVGDPVDRLPHVVTFSCLYVDGEALVGELDRRGLRRGVRLGLHLQHARAEPRPRGDGGAHPRQRARHPAAGGRGARPRRRRRARSARSLPDAVAAVRAELGAAGAVSAAVEVDARGLRCPLPVIRLAAAARDAAAGTVVTVLATDPAAASRRARVVPDARPGAADRRGRGRPATGRRTSGSYVVVGAP